MKSNRFALLSHTLPQQNCDDGPVPEVLTCQSAFYVHMQLSFASLGSATAGQPAVRNYVPNKCSHVVGMSGALETQTS